MTIVLRIDGKPSGKGRPRFGNGRVFTDADTELAEACVQVAWQQAGRQRLPDGAVAFVVELVITRPKSHFKRDGSLSAEGQRNPVPRRKPDLDNALKLLMDALNGLAYRDDVDVAMAYVVRRWTRDDEGEHTLLTLSSLDPAAELHRFIGEDRSTA